MEPGADASFPALAGFSPVEGMPLGPSFVGVVAAVLSGALLVAVVSPAVVLFLLESLELQPTHRMATIKKGYIEMDFILVIGRLAPCLTV